MISRWLQAVRASLDIGQPPGAGRIAAWTWRSVPEPALGSLTPGAPEWDMTRYRAYQAQLAGQPVGATFRRAAAFLRLAAEGSSLSCT